MIAMFKRGLMAAALMVAAAAGAQAQTPAERLRAECETGRADACLGLARTVPAARAMASSEISDAWA